MKVQKEKFDAALRAMLKTKPVSQKKIKTKLKRADRHSTIDSLKR